MTSSSIQQGSQSGRVCHGMDLPERRRLVADLRVQFMQRQMRIEARYRQKSDQIRALRQSSGALEAERRELLAEIGENCVRSPGASDASTELLTRHRHVEARLSALHTTIGAKQRELTLYLDAIQLASVRIAQADRLLAETAHKAG